MFVFKKNKSHTVLTGVMLDTAYECQTEENTLFYVFKYVFWLWIFFCACGKLIASRNTTDGGEEARWKVRGSLITASSKPGSQPCGEALRLLRLPRGLILFCTMLHGLSETSCGAMDHHLLMGNKASLPLNGVEDAAVIQAR